MIDELIVKIVDSMINTDIISKDDKEAYVYAYTITLEKVLTLITISIMGVVLNRFVNIIIFLCTFMFLRRRTGGFHLETFGQCFIGTNLICMVKVYDTCYVSLYGICFIHNMCWYS